MNAGTIIAVLGLVVTILLFIVGQAIADRRALTAENKALLAANWDLKLAVIELKGGQDALRRTLDSLPTAPRQERPAP